MLKYIGVFIVSMLPVAELRLSIPLAIGMGIDKYVAVLICIIGNIVPIPFIYYFARRVLQWGAERKYIGRFCKTFLSRGERAGQKLVNKTGRYGIFVALMIFVGIPLPGTGAWTGAMGASFLDLGPKTTFFAVALGVVIAGCIMTLASVIGLHIFGF